MKTYLEKRITRFRAYQLGNAGSSFSYFDGTTLTLIEARLTDLSRARLDKEFEFCGVSRIGCLHITSWDTDHCTVNDLNEILTRYRPQRIEFPGYPPTSETAKECRALIQGYRELMATAGVNVTIKKIDPQYVASLNPAVALGYRDVVYHPRYLSEKSNNNSTVKLFRTGVFNVASLGDVEDPAIGAYLRSSRLFNSETDILILAHHGADNGLTTRKFLKMVKPTVAICSSNYDNQYEHPREEIRELLNEMKIRLYTTKTGDVAIQSVVPHTHAYKVINLQSDSTQISSTADFVSKKSNKLRFNLDTIKNIYGSRRTFPH